MFLTSPLQTWQHENNFSPTMWKPIFLKLIWKQEMLAFHSECHAVHEGGMGWKAKNPSQTLMTYFQAKTKLQIKHLNDIHIP